MNIDSVFGVKVRNPRHEATWIQDALSGAAYVPYVGRTPEIVNRPINRCQYCGRTNQKHGHISCYGCGAPR